MLVDLRLDGIERAIKDGFREVASKLDKPFQEMDGKRRHDEEIKLTHQSIKASQDSVKITQKLADSGLETAVWTKKLAVFTIVLAAATIFLAVSALISNYLTYQQYQHSIDKSPNLAVYSYFDQGKDLVIVVNNQVEYNALGLRASYKMWSNLANFDGAPAGSPLHALLKKEQIHFSFPLKSVNALEQFCKNVYGAESCEIPINFELQVECQNCDKEDITYLKKTFVSDYRCFKEDNGSL